MAADKLHLALTSSLPHLSFFSLEDEPSSEELMYCRWFFHFILILPLRFLFCTTYQHSLDLNMWYDHISLHFHPPPPKKKVPADMIACFHFCQKQLVLHLKVQISQKIVKKARTHFFFIKLSYFFCLELCFTGIFNTCISLSDMFEWESSDISVFLLFLSVFYVPVQRVQTLTDEAALMSLLWYWTHFRHKNLKGKRSL